MSKTDEQKFFYITDPIPAVVGEVKLSRLYMDANGTEEAIKVKCQNGQIMDIPLKKGIVPNVLITEIISKPTNLTGVYTDPINVITP